MEANDMAKMREALTESRNLLHRLANLTSAGKEHWAMAKVRAEEIVNITSEKIPAMIMQISAALAARPLTGKWVNGTGYEYEYAYCSACGRMQWADWDSHRQAEANIESFADNYRFCPSCGAKMEGGVYVK